MEYYNNIITQKSFDFLVQLKREHEFILIGGWAVFFYTKQLKSKDIDIVVDYPALEKLRGSFTVTKNDRLKKYEIQQGVFDVDVYVFHYSNPGIPAEAIAAHTTVREGLTVPRPEILMILKQRAYLERQGTPKGDKDRIDIISILARVPSFDCGAYRKTLAQHGLDSYYESLRSLLAETHDMPELGLNQHTMRVLKKRLAGTLG